MASNRRSFWIAPAVIFLCSIAGGMFGPSISGASAATTEDDIKQSLRSFTKRLIFSSNIHDPKGRNFDIYLVNIDGSGLERVSFNDTFDGFPMFSPDGKHLVFASNRHAKAEGETNVFIAEWVE